MDNAFGGVSGTETTGTRHACPPSEVEWEVPSDSAIRSRERSRSSHDGSSLVIEGNEHRTELSGLLATQMALSLEDARLYRGAQEEQQRTRAILEAITLPMIISRLTDGEILYANPATAKVGHTSVGRLIGSSTTDHFAGPAERERLRGIIQRHGEARDGYTSNVIVHRGVLEEGTKSIQKPFSQKDLATKVGLAIARFVGA